MGIYSRKTNNNIENVNEKRKYEKEELFFYIALTQSIPHIYRRVGYKEYVIFKGERLVHQ